MTKGKKKKTTRSLRDEPAPVVKRFGNYLYRRRRRSHLTLRALAKRAQMPHTSIYQFENRGKNPRLDELVALSNAFNERLTKFLKPLVPE
jgi:transcriptional regulator with XRE-family HTH domain